MACWRQLNWSVDFHADFVPEFRKLEEEVRVELVASVNMLREFGPALGRPKVDTLKTSKHKNMKELRFNVAGGVWRFAFAFDPNREAIVFCGGDKSVGDSDVFYRQLTKAADRRFDDHLKKLEEREAAEKHLTRKKKRN